MRAAMLAEGSPWRRPFAHRGLHDDRLPENSLTAAEAAIAHGYGIECDIQPASDGTPMVFHDPSLRRMTGLRAQTSSLAPDQLGRLHLAGSDQTIPTLAAFLTLIAGRAPLLIELKDQSGSLSPGFDQLAESAITSLKDYTGPVALMSFNPSLIRAAHRLSPEIPVGLVTSGFSLRSWPRLSAKKRRYLRNIKDFSTSGASFISHDHRDLTNPAVTNLRGAKVPIFTWTIRSQAEATAAKAAGADVITFENYRP